jgi:hypothetical protein
MRDVGRGRDRPGAGFGLKPTTKKTAKNDGRPELMKSRFGATGGFPCNSSGHAMESEGSPQGEDQGRSTPTSDTAGLTPEERFRLQEQRAVEILAKDKTVVSTLGSCSLGLGLKIA